MIWDCLIIGGGPAGLTATTYLARFRRKILLIDAGGSRAAAITESHNHPGFGRGISGTDLLKLLREQAQRYDVEIRSGRVEKLCMRGHGFLAEVGGERVSAAHILLATGIEDIPPELPGLEGAVAHSVVRYCPICDGYEAMDKKIAVFGPLDHAAKEAVFLRTYSKSVTVLPTDTPDHRPSVEALCAGDIAIAPAVAREFCRTSSGLVVKLENGSVLEFDALYPALGCNVHSELAKALVARCNSMGCVEVDQKQRTSVAGLYAAGDVVSDLHQISVAEGHAAVAATAIHNSLPRNPR
jgi:thioredoxin reductase (NADPH)